MKEGLQSKYGYLEFWDIETMNEGMGNADIGIVTLGEVVELATTEFADDFLQYVSVVILLYPSTLIAIQPIVIPQILEKIKISHEDITYIVCDTSISGMTDMLADTLKKQFIHVRSSIRNLNTEAWNGKKSNGFMIIIISKKKN